MVEHLAVTVPFSNGNKPLQNYREENRMIPYLLSNQEMPTDAKFFLVGNKLAEPITSNFLEAVDFLIRACPGFGFWTAINDKTTKMTLQNKVNPTGF